LKHESLDDSMEVEAVVVALLNQIKEIACRDRHGIGKEFDGDVACGGLHENVHGLTTYRHFKRICMSWNKPHLDN